MFITEIVEILVAENIDEILITENILYKALAFLLSWDFHYSSGKRSAATRTFTLFGMELVISSSPSTHS